MNFNHNDYPHPSRRKTIFSKNGMVATSQPLAAQAGLEMMRKGGNAVDAAIATAAALTVLEPTSNGLGSDSFALIWTNDNLYGLNSSGTAPINISREEIINRGYDKIPEYGFIPVTVPGAPASWAKISDRFGILPFKEILKPAIHYAEKGYPVSPVTARLWQSAFKKYQTVLKADKYKYWFETFAPDNRAPYPGEVWKSPDHASTLKSIAETDSESFYKGEIARKIIEFSSKYQGFLSEEDLHSFSPEWVDPVGINYKGYRVWEIPPNGQGIVALIALNLLKQMNFPAKNTVETYHNQLEAIKLAFADGKKYITDKKEMRVEVDKLLSENYAEKRRKLINRKAGNPESGHFPDGDTVYLAAADNKGNMVSFIQSNYLGFGSGLVVPGTGISLQNRGNCFSLKPEHDNCIKPGKKPYHTIIPGFLTQNNFPVGPFGVMGGYMQPQGHLQVIMNTIDFNLNPQAALDAPRWRWIEGKKINLEPQFPLNIAKLLEEKGHNIDIALNSYSFGRGQIIWYDREKQVLMGGTEPRADGTIAAY